MCCTEILETFNNFDFLKTLQFEQSEKTMPFYIKQHIQYINMK